MAGEVQFEFRPGATAYFLVRDRTNQIWNSSGAGAFENYGVGDYPVYPISATQDGGTAHYAGTFPPSIVPGVYAISAHQQLGGSPAESDPVVAVGDLQWNGVATAPLSDTVTSGQFSLLGPIRIAKGVQIPNFMFQLVSSLDHVTPFTSGLCSGQIVRDGGATFGPLQSGSFAEVGLGFYRLQALTSGDLTCNTAALVFNAVGVSGGTSDQRSFSLVTQRVSGSI